MKDIFKILQEEKDRILGMHKIATENQYLIEQQSPQIPTTYTVKNAQVTLKGQNKKTTAAAEDLKIFKGAKFIKQGGNIVANTKYQFLDVFGNVISGVGKTPGARSSNKTYQGNVTYGCSTGKYTVNMRTDLMFYDKTLSPMLQKMCKAKTTEKQPATQTPNTQPNTPQLTDSQKLDRAKKCGHNSWEEYKNSNWQCKGKTVVNTKSKVDVTSINKQIQQYLGNQQPTGQITDADIDAILTKLG